jgi:Glycosyltransferase family 87
MHPDKETPKSLLSTRVLYLSAFYAIFCIVWAWVAQTIAPALSAAGHAGKIPSVLNWSNHVGERLPAEHYLDVWRSISLAVELAAVLHLAIVLFIWSIDSKRPAPVSREHSGINLALSIFAAVLFAVCIMAGPKGDYVAYIKEWHYVLEGANPWQTVPVNNDPLQAFAMYNVYGPLFNLLSLPILVTPLANKLLFAFVYVVCVVWLAKDLGRDQGPTRWAVITFWLINPFPWVELAYYGHFDVLVGAACIVAVHCKLRSKGGWSGVSLAIGILLKFMPIVILPFLVFDNRQFNFRLLGSCAALVAGAFLLSFLVWGTPTFEPIAVALSRTPGASIYAFLPPDGFLHSLALDYWGWLEKSLWLIVGSIVFIWSMVKRADVALSSCLAILVTVLFYRLGFNNYEMVLFLLISYWAVSKWTRLKEHRLLVGILVCYFGFLAVLDVAILIRLEGYGHYSMITVFLKWILGCILLIGLMHFSTSKRDRIAA